MSHANVRHTTTPPIYGCRWCGWPTTNHGLSYAASVGYHSWERPTAAQVEARAEAHTKRFIVKEKEEA